MNIIQLLKTKLGYFNSNQISEGEIFYVAGSQTLPPPLNLVEEEKLLKKTKVYMEMWQKPKEKPGDCAWFFVYCK